ncbi:hypothetical protein AAIH53_26290, partial [Pseudomonas aeruginosa]
VVQVFQNHAHSTFTDFGGVGRSLSHGLIFSRVEASTKPGAIHQLWGALDLVMFTVSLAAFFSRSRRFYAPLTLAYLPLAMIDIAVSLGA